jgi:hypothetical protein
MTLDSPLVTSTIPEPSLESSLLSSFCHSPPASTKVEEDILKITSLYNKPSHSSEFSVSNRLHPGPGDLDFLSYSWGQSPVKANPDKAPGGSVPDLWQTSAVFGSPLANFVMSPSEKRKSAPKPAHSSLTGLDAFSLVQTLQSNTTVVDHSKNHVMDLM